MRVSERIAAVERIKAQAFEAGRQAVLAEQQGTVQVPRDLLRKAETMSDIFLAASCAPPVVAGFAAEVAAFLRGITAAEGERNV